MTTTDTDEDQFVEYEEGEPGTEVATLDDEDEEYDEDEEPEVVETKGQIAKSPVIGEILTEISELDGPVKPKKGMTKAKATALNQEIADACTNYGDRFEDWVDAGEKVVTLIEQGLEYRAFAALKLEPVEWIKSVVQFPLIDPNARKLLTKVLFQLGVSVRGIGEITGSSKSTASNDLKDVSKAGHVTIGADGKEYAASEDEESEEDSDDDDVIDAEVVEEPANVLSAAKDAAEALSEWAHEIETLSRSDKFTKSAKTIHKRYADTLTEAYELLGEVIDKLTAAAEEL